MAQKEEWILGKEAAIILTKLSGHTVTSDYVRQMAYKGIAKEIHEPMNIIDRT